MFDTMTLTKVLGGFCGAFLIFLLGKFAAETIYTAKAGQDDGHGGAHVQGYMIDTGSDEGASAEAEAGPSLEELLASADIGKGERVFNKCKACHKLEKGENSTGPYLYGVVGRPVDTADGYGYSGALEKVVDVWTPEHLNGFLTKPGSYAPGTTMGFTGLSKAEDRANLIAFLDSIDE
ncbi:cytochrome c family protein [Roseovarius aestuarii]|nr:cytochrome c family protein [Roseovarius aestuarii]